MGSGAADGRPSLGTATRAACEGCARAGCGCGWLGTPVAEGAALPDGACGADGDQRGDERQWSLHVHAASQARAVPGESSQPQGGCSPAAPDGAQGQVGVFPSDGREVLPDEAGEQSKGPGGAPEGGGAGGNACASGAERPCRSTPATHAERLCESTPATPVVHDDGASSRQAPPGTWLSGSLFAHTHPGHTYAAHTTPAHLRTSAPHRRTPAADASTPERSADS